LLSYLNFLIIDLNIIKVIFYFFYKTYLCSIAYAYYNGNQWVMEYSKSKVVKTLNTMWCGLMVNPNLIGNGEHVNYISGNDADSKIKLISLLNEFGWKNEFILDLGDLTAARATEAVLPIWLRVYGATKNGAFNFKIIR
jgi:predicted dinucleotide-binding enzyme